MASSLTTKLADHLKRLRQDRHWSLDQLSQESGISRATLSRLENAEVSPTTEVLAKLCTTYNLTMSRLLSMVEENFRPVVRSEEQPEWTDKAAGFTRRVLSPSAPSLAGEVLHCHLNADSHLSYDAPSVAGLEHHLILLEGTLTVRVEGHSHILKSGDSLRYLLNGTTEFHTVEKTAATYILILIGG